ncbi:hypothetical protein [Pseudonocardia spinosispora]|uniref:hypothetical protein n=1 Tax=Pseudonocardia spinosispora TaxID=103441 RepID=UPI000401749C|nr:hypothetical protein [Pseudonocardia spinosispora]
MARGLTAAFVCTLLSFAGHVSADGARPNLGLLVVLGLLLAGFLTSLADRRRGPVAILALVGGSQLALHELLQVLGTGMHHSTGRPLAMFCAHALATVITAAILTGAESAVFVVASALVSGVALIPVGQPAAQPPRRAALPDAPVEDRPSGMLGRRFHRRRGPPRAVVHA